MVNAITHYDYVILTTGNTNHTLLIIGIDEDNNYLKKQKNSQKLVATSPLYDINSFYSYTSDKQEEEKKTKGKRGLMCPVDLHA